MSDWHPEDIKAELRKRGETLASLARKNGLSAQSISFAIQARASERAERVVAECIGVAPSIIWPSRYHCGQRIRLGKARSAAA